MHCNPDQQNQLAKMMVNHMGEALLRYDELVETGQATSLAPIHLASRVLVKGKVKKPKEKPRRTTSMLRFGASVVAGTMCRGTLSPSSLHREASGKLVRKGSSFRAPSFRVMSANSTKHMIRRKSSMGRKSSLGRSSSTDAAISRARTTLARSTLARSQTLKEIKKNGTDAYYACHLSLRSEPLPVFLGAAPPKWALPITSINEDRYLKELGLSFTHRYEIEGLLSGHGASVSAAGLTEEQKTSRAVHRLAVDPPFRVGVLQRCTSKRHLRPFPLGLRFSGKNMSPLPAWLGGAQHVCLNFSDNDLAVQLHHALFRGAGGFVLKPADMRLDTSTRQSTRNSAGSAGTVGTVRESDMNRRVTSSDDCGTSCRSVTIDLVASPSERQSPKERQTSCRSVTTDATASFREHHSPKERQASCMKITHAVSSGRSMRNSSEEDADDAEDAHDSDTYWPPACHKLRRTSIEILSLVQLPKRREARPSFEGHRGACHQYHPGLSGAATPPNQLAPSAPELIATVHSIGGFSAVGESLPLPRSAKTEVSLAPRDGGMHVAFGQTLHCIAAEPHATFLRIGIVDSRREVAYEIAVLGRLRRGYRVLQMRSALGTRIELCRLFVRISFGSELNKWASPRQQEKQLREQHEADLLQRKRIEGLEAALGTLQERSQTPRNTIRTPGNPRVPTPSVSMLDANVHAFDGYDEMASRLVFPYSDNFMHLAEAPPPLHMTILESGEVEKERTPLWLGGTWARAELHAMSDGELREHSQRHVIQLDESAVRHDVIEALTGTERDVDLCDRALITFSMVQTMADKAKAERHLHTKPNTSFVWARGDGSIAVVQTWKVRYNDTFRGTFECSQENPDEAVFSPHKVGEFRRSMRNVFGAGADQVPLVYARKRTHNPHLVFAGSREALIDFLESRTDVLNALGILEIFPDGFLATVRIDGKVTGTKWSTLSEEGQSVIYIKSGFERVAQAKPLHMFDAECCLGKPLVLLDDLLEKLSREFDAMR
mmetsp:Transcript_1998/g.5040  ORF Transcript_1998/g.5040 Transcript_1998/m.5040 type:complete len:1003 (+) Transcript_1998:348-3356(+)